MQFDTSDVDLRLLGLRLVKAALPGAAVRAQATATDIKEDGFQSMESAKLEFPLDAITKKQYDILLKSAIEAKIHPNKYTGFYQLPTPPWWPDTIKREYPNMIPIENIKKLLVAILFPAGGGSTSSSIL
jgi:hypothetical protein